MLYQTSYLKYYIIKNYYHIFFGSVHLRKQMYFLIADVVRNKKIVREFNGKLCSIH
jgi:hypothetical protein